MRAVELMEAKGPQTASIARLRLLNAETLRVLAKSEGRS